MKKQKIQLRDFNWKGFPWACTGNREYDRVFLIAKLTQTPERFGLRHSKKKEIYTLEPYKDFLKRSDLI